jgi:mono/diheme cytochrome c family protein
VGVALEKLMGKLKALWQFLFGDSARAFGSLSVILLIALAIAPAKESFREWRRYQRQYLHLIRGRGEAASLQRRFAGGLQQIWLPEIGVTDRCGTCHLGLKEASLRDVSTQPFRPHPPIPHSLTQFGCVLCHRGQGAATGVVEAHRSTLAWEQPILPARYLEAGCGQCHRDALTGTPQLNLGRKLLARYGCVSCHVVKTPDGRRLAATTDAPLLTHIAAKTTREWIFAWLKNPQAYAITATMPNFQLSDADARDISAFLIAQSTPYLPAGAQAEAPAAAPDADVQAGASLYGESFCASCHADVNAAGMLVGGNVGPELTRVGSKVTPEWLAAWLNDPKTYDPDTAMPHYRFNAKQIALLSGFLESKTDSDFLANVHLEPATQEQAAHGRALVIERGCASCHQINGIKKPDNFAPELTTVGSESLAKIVFAPGVPHRLSDYLQAKIRQPHTFPGAKMPQYTFTQPQVDALVTALLAQTERAATLPASLRVPGKEESHYRPAGKAGELMADMNCFSCHTINGRGGDMAPDLTWEGSAVQKRWLVSFLKNPNTLRPALIRRMPRFNVTDAEAETLADYILTVYQTPAFDRDEIDAARFTTTEVDTGKQLFYSKYACQSCHILDPQKDRGYIGPTLTQVGARLNAAWIFHWLKDPQALRPGTLEPNQHMSDADARALTAFLMRQTREAKP